MIELISNLSLGFGVAFTLENLFYCLIGVTLGTFIGVLPGIGPLATISMLLPLSFYLEPVTALIMLAGVYYGAMYGGSTAAILMNLPGTGASAVICLDGNPMAKQGRAGPALVATALASFAGSVIAIFIVGLFAPLLARWALSFGPVEYFSLMVTGLLAAVLLASGSPLKGVAMVFVGLMLGLVGIDVNSGAYRFTFGVPELYGGVSFVVVAMGVFGFGEIISNVEQRWRKGVAQPKYAFGWRDLLLTRDDLRQSVLPVLRGSAVGAFVGVLPGAGTTISSFAAYAVEKQVARDPSRFGKGAIEGVTAPEAANNAAANTSFIPTLTLGIPGDAVMALMLAAIMIHGISPGPQVMTNQPDLFWGLLASMVIGNILLLILNIPLVGLWVRVLSIPYGLLYPPVVLLICVGVFSVNNSVFDIFLVAGFGVFGYVLIKLGCEPAPMLLGFILGPLMEENFRRAMILSRGDFRTFIESPISLSFLLLAAVMASWSIFSAIRKGRAKNSREPRDGNG